MQIIEPLSNVWTICLSFATITLNFHSYRNTQQAFARSNQPKKSTVRNNLNAQYCNCSVSSASFSTYTYFVHPKRLAENYKTLYKLVFLKKLLEKTTKRPAKCTISKPLLWNIIYRMLLVLPTIQELFWYCQHYWVKLFPICHLFSLWADQFLLVLL